MRLPLPQPTIGGIVLVALLGCGEAVPPDNAADGAVDVSALEVRPLTRTVRLGGVDAPPPEAFQRPPQLTLAADGSLLALDMQAAEVRRFAPDGTFLNSIGGAGEGPGEFTFAYRAGRVGDTVWIRNATPPKVSWFTLDGRHLRTDVPEEVVLARGGMAIGPDALLAGGRALQVERIHFGDQEAGQASVPLVVLDADGAVADTLTHLLDPGGLYFDGAGSFAVRPFSRPPLHRAVPDGSGVVVVDWDEARLGAGAVELRVFDVDGGLRHADTLRLPPSPLTAVVRDSVIGATADSVRAVISRIPAIADVEEPADLEGLVRSDLALGATYPAIDGMLVGADGAIWLERVLDTNTREWVVAGTDGALCFRVNVPDGERPVAADGAVLWTVSVDGLDVPYLTRWCARN